MHSVGMVLHPERDSAEAVAAVLGWAADKGAQVLGIDAEIRRLSSAAVAVTAEELGQRADLVVSLGGDGTMLRAMRLADRQHAMVLGLTWASWVSWPKSTCRLAGSSASAMRPLFEFTIEPRFGG
jgi:NAD+ kinase